MTNINQQWVEQSWSLNPTPDMVIQRKRLRRLHNAFWKHHSTHELLDMNLFTVCNIVNLHYYELICCHSQVSSD